jgi:outer membrane protein
MNQILNKISVLAFICFAQIAWSQSLQEFINTALENNYQIRIQKNEAQIASNNNTIGNAGQLPTINLGGTASTSLNNTHQELSDGSVREGSNAKNSNINASATANWTLFNGFKIQAKKEQLDLLSQLGEQNSKFYIEQTVSDIVVAYHQLVYENQLLENYKQSLTISSYRLTLEKKRKEVGAGKTIDYGQALVDYQSDSIRFLAQMNTIKSLEIELNQLLSNPLEGNLSVDVQSFQMLPFPNKDSLILSVQNNNSSLGQMQLAELIAETELRMTMADHFPKIDLFAGYQFSKSFAEVGFINSNRSFGPVVGASINFNLFNGGKTNLAIKNSSIYQENAKLTKEQTHLNINADVLRMYYQYKSIQERVKLAESNVETINQVYEIASEQLKRGAINGYDFRLTQLSLLNTQLTLMELQFSLKAIEINLNRLSGEVLKAYL